MAAASGGAADGGHVTGEKLATSWPEAFLGYGIAIYNECPQPKTKVGYRSRRTWLLVWTTVNRSAKIACTANTELPTSAIHQGCDLVASSEISERSVEAANGRTLPSAAHH